MSWRDLVTGMDGRLSHTKLWPNIASLVATGMFIYQGVKGTLTNDTWLIYLGCVGGYSAVITAIVARASKSPKDGNE